MAEQEQKLPKTKIQGEIGTTGLVEWNGHVQDHFVTNLKTSDRKVKIYDEMYRLDPTAAAMVNISSLFMRNAGIDVEPASDSPADIEAADFVRECLHDMTRDFEHVMADIVMFLPYGWMDMEIVYMQRDGVKSKYDDNRIGWRKWAPRHPVTLNRWKLDANGGLNGMHQLGSPDYRDIYIPIEKLLHFTATGLGKDNPEGSSILEGAYKSWWECKGLSIIECILAERASGTPVIELPENADLSTNTDSDLERAKRIVRNIKVSEDMGLTLPAGFKFYYANPASGPAVNIGEMIMQRRRDMARVFVLDFIMLGGGDQGSWAMHSDKSALYIRALNTYLNVVASVINRHAIPRLFALNAFPGITDYPRVYFNKITKIDLGAFSEVIGKLFNAGAISYDLDTENTIRREIGLPEVEKTGIIIPLKTAGAEEGASGEEKPDGEEKPEKEPEDEEEPEDEGDEEEMTEFADASRMSPEESKTFTDRVGSLMLRDYDRLSSDLAVALAEDDDEERWTREIEATLMLISASMLSRMRKGMFTVWRRTTGSDPDIEGLRAILSELEFQKGYIDDSLFPDIRRRVLEERRTLKDEAATVALIALGILGAMAAFRWRVKQYAGGVFKVYANWASPVAAYEAMADRAQSLNVDIWINTNTGMLEGEDGLLVRRLGPDDESTCDGCSREIAKKWRNPVNDPPVPIGQLECGANDRCWFEWKLGGRIYP